MLKQESRVLKQKALASLIAAIEGWLGGIDELVSYELTRDALRAQGRYIAGARVLICGASYREDVGDTRYSGSEMVARKLDFRWSSSFSRAKACSSAAFLRSTSL